jgi:hypothetical protein
MTDSMTQTPATWNQGTVAKPGPMMVVNPERQVADEQLDVLDSMAGLNGPFVADLLASCTTHERLGVNLFKTLEARTDNPAAKSRLNEFQSDAMSAVSVYEGLAAQLGVPISYASPPARLTEAMDTKLVSAFLLTGAADQATIELKGVEAVMIASTLCLANANLLASLAKGMEDSPMTGNIRDAAAQLVTTAEKHLEWAATTQQQMVLTQARSSMAGKAMSAAESVVGKVRDILGR